MAITVENKTLSQIIADINQRIARLEAGGKPLADISSTASASFTLAANSEDYATFQFSWSDTDTQSVVSGTEFISIFVDNDLNDSYKIPTGASVFLDQYRVLWFDDERRLSTDPNKQRVIVAIRNTDSVSHTYYIRSVNTFLNGQTGDTQ